MPVADARSNKVGTGGNIDQKIMAKILQQQPL